MFSRPHQVEKTSLIDNINNNQNERAKMNSKKYDVYKDGDKYLIFERGQVSEYGEIPEGKPVNVSTEEDWWNWCDANGARTDDAIRLCERVGYYAAGFADDLKAKAERLLTSYIEEGREAGWGDLEIDRSGMSYTFRRSAAWKDEPIYYTFNQPLKWTNPEKGEYTGMKLRARDNLVMLWGMADAAHEIGFDIVFDAELHIHVFGVRYMWRTTFEY